MIYKRKTTVACIGSMGKDVFFPVSQRCILNDLHKSQFQFDCGEKVHVSDRFIAPGGCACNVSIGLARLTVATSVIGVIGDDQEGQWIIEEMKKEGVCYSHVHVNHQYKTDLSMILVDESSGERTIFVNRDVGETMFLKGVRLLKNYQWCFVGSLYGDDIKHNMHIIHNHIMQNRSRLAYNPGMHNIKNNPQIVCDLLHHAQIVFVNKEEAQSIIALFEQKESNKLEKLGSMLLMHMHANDAVVVVTDGDDGAMIVTQKNMFFVHTMQKEICDTTGAGDAFASGFLAAYIQKKSIEKCAQWGSANSHSVIGQYGAQKGLLKYDIIKKEAQKFFVEKIK